MRNVVIAFMAALLSSLGAGAAQASDPAHWGYGPDDGPKRWAELDPAWATCGSGRSQSPIDLVDSVARPREELETTFPRTSVRIVRHEHVLDFLDNGHTIQVNVDASETLSLGGSAYDLVQYHFHAPSEHTIDGRHHPMELHLVHRSADGKLAVVGALIEEGPHNPAYDPVWKHMPTRVGEEVHLEGVQVDIDALVPESPTAWRYRGSLTTPPCSEGVAWLVMRDTVKLSPAQIRQFRDVFDGNNRPVQPRNGRELVLDSGDDAG